MDKEKKRNSRKEVLNAACKVFAERGYADTTMSDIAENAKVSEAYIYRHFKGKEELFFSIPKEKLKEEATSIEERLFGVDDTMQKLRIILWVFARNLIEDRDHGRLMLLQMNSMYGLTPKTFKEGVNKAARLIPKKILEIITEGQKSGDIVPDIDSRTALNLILGPIVSLLTSWFLNNCAYDPWPYIEQIFKRVKIAISTKTLSNIDAIDDIKQNENHFDNNNKT